MKIEASINPNYSLMKSIATEDSQKQTVKLDYLTGTGYLKQAVSPNLTKYILDNSSKVDACCDVLSKDTSLQSYIFTPTHEGTDISKLEKFWNKRNKLQLSYAIYEEKSYGYGCCEIIFDDKTGEPTRLEQFPAKTACIKKKVNSKGQDVFYAIQRKPSGNEIPLRLYHKLEDYDESDKDLPICLWIGGDNENEFYSTPKWFRESDNVLGKINLDILNAQNLDKGNPIGGVLTFIGPPQRPNATTGEFPEQTLRKQIKNAGTGNLVIYLESMDKKYPIDVNYTKISQDNWSYLINYAESIDKNVLSSYRVPKTRLMINDESESMNSHKSDSIWEIYVITLNYEQLPYELLIQEFNRLFFKIDAEVEMDTPMFTDKREIEIKNTIELFKNGLLTIGESIQKIQKLLPDIEFEEIDLHSELMNERFFNGNVLGAGNVSQINQDYEKIMDWLQGADLQ